MTLRHYWFTNLSPDWRVIKCHRFKGKTDISFFATIERLSCATMQYSQQIRWKIKGDLKSSVNDNRTNIAIYSLSQLSEYNSDLIEFNCSAAFLRRLIRRLDSRRPWSSDCDFSHLIVYALVMVRCIVRFYSDCLQCVTPIYTSVNLRVSLSWLYTHWAWSLHIGKCLLHGERPLKTNNHISIEYEIK